MEQNEPNPAALPANLDASVDTLPTGWDGQSRNPDDYQWVPVLRRKRADGWTTEKQRLFIETLADTGSVAQAARSVGMSEQSCYRLRRQPGAEGFAAAWDAAIDAASKKLIDAAFERAIHGSDEPVWNKDGQVIGRRYRQSDRLMMFLLRAYGPERFRHAIRDNRAADEPLPAPPVPVAQAIEQIFPPVPDAPHRLMPPGELEMALDCADLSDGKPAKRYRDHELELVGKKPDRMPLGEEFERGLEDMKRENAGLGPMSDDEWDDHRRMLLG